MGGWTLSWKTTRTEQEAINKRLHGANVLLEDIINESNSFDAAICHLYTALNVYAQRQFREKDEGKVKNLSEMAFVYNKM